MEKKESFIHKHPYLSVIGGIIVFLFILGFISSIINNDNLAQITNNQNLQKNEQQIQNSQMTWHEVATFVGTNDKKTDTFNIQGDRFKLTYTVQPANDYSAFYLFVYEPGNNIFIESFNLDSGSEESISYSGPGEYYLDIGAANLRGWTVKIEDYY